MNAQENRRSTALSAPLPSLLPPYFRLLVIARREKRPERPMILLRGWPQTRTTLRIRSSLYYYYVYMYPPIEVPVYRYVVGVLSCACTAYRMRHAVYVARSALSAPVPSIYKGFTVDGSAFSPASSRINSAIGLFVCSMVNF